MTQADALTILKTGANVFLTGEPGSGKTHTVNDYVSYLRTHGIEPAITASTGIAATHIHGQTIHSWSGIGIRKSLSAYEFDHIATTESTVRRIRNTTTLIIDEISMIDAATLDLVDVVCREIRQRNEPFGGIQIVLVGDFFQLPPVTRGGESVHFAFESGVWHRMRPIICYLTEQHRQSDDVFLRLLSAIRKNTYGVLHHEHLERRRIVDREALDNLDGIKQLTRLFAHNIDVDAINSRELEKLPGETAQFTMSNKGSVGLVATLQKGCLSPENLLLKVGAVVMCTKNNREKQYVNGTLGVVTGFEVGTHYPIITTRDKRTITIEPVDWNIEDRGKVKACITQIPLRLAWAITIHKSQGMSLDAALMDLSQVFEYGQGYVALSRVRSLSGLHITGWNQQTFLVHPRILIEDTVFEKLSQTAEETFASMPTERIIGMHHNFILASGGVVEEKNKKSSKGADSGTKLGELRKKYPNAYRPWSEEDDMKLTALFHEKTKQRELIKIFGRQHGSIHARLVKLGLIKE